MFLRQPTSVAARQPLKRRKKDDFELQKTISRDEYSQSFAAISSSDGQLGTSQIDSVLSVDTEKDTGSAK